MKRKVEVFLFVLALMFSLVSFSYADTGIILQKSILMKYNLDGSVKKDVIIKYESFNKDTTGFLKEFYLPLTPMVKSRINEVLVNDEKRDFKIVRRMFAPPYEQFGRLYLGIGPISPLDIVTIRYTQLFKFSPVDGYFWGAETTSKNAVVKKLSLKFVLPSAVKFRYKIAEGCRLIRDRISKEERTIEVEGENIIPGSNVFVYSSFPDWTAVANWVSKKIKSVSDATPSGLELFGDKEKILKKLIGRVRLVELPVGIELPYVRSPEVVWKYKRGSEMDKVLLLMSVMKKLGVECNYFITTPLYRLSDYPPSPALFDDFLASFRIRGNTIWYTSSSRSIRYDFPIPSYQGRDALSVDGVASLPLSPAERNYNELEARLSLSTDGTISGDVDMSVSGYWERKDYDWLKAYYYKGKLKPLEKSYNYTYRFAAVFAKNRATFNIPFFRWKFLEDIRRQIVSKKDQKVIIPSTAMLKEVISIALPSGYKVAYLPDDIELSYDEGSVDIRFKRFKGRIGATLVLKINRRMLDEEAKRHILVLISAIEVASRQSVLLSK